MAGKNSKDSGKKGPATIQNRKAGFDYHFEEVHEAGIALVGSEVKSLFLGRANLTDAYCQVSSGELWLFNLDIEPYEFANAFGHERRRKRKLLMHKKEIEQLRRKTEEKGFSLIPAKIYFKEGKCKVSVAVARGKKQYDKRESIKERDEKRAMDRDL
ncbi:MAG: SsrA-binding protein SmpB [Armatimonadetes bacterium]|nr:SsrA-binding protein SmpB [Armatimonadota bacterium]